MPCNFIHAFFYYTALGYVNFQSVRLSACLIIKLKQLLSFSGISHFWQHMVVYPFFSASVWRFLSVDFLQTSTGTKMWQWICQTTVIYWYWLLSVTMMHTGIMSPSEEVWQEHYSVDGCNLSVYKHQYAMMSSKLCLL